MLAAGIASAAPVHAAAAEQRALRFELAGIGVAGEREDRAFRVHGGDAILGGLLITCEAGEMVSAAFRPRLPNDPASPDIARRADHRLCVSRAFK